MDNDDNSIAFWAVTVLCGVFMLTLLKWAI